MVRAIILFSFLVAQSLCGGGFLLAFNLKAQDSTNVSEKKIGVELSSLFSYNSTGIDNRFALDLINGNEIGRAQSGRILNSSGKAIRAAFEFNRTLGVVFGTEDNSRFRIAFADRQFGALRLSNDGFGLLFSGNADYQGKHADLSNTGLTLLRYQQLQASYEFRTKKGTCEIGFSILNGERNVDLSGDASLFTDTLGVALDLSANAELRQSDPASKSMFSHNGSGFSVDLRYKRPIAFLSSTLDLEAKDLGLLSWNNRSTVQRIDTSFSYEGIEIRDLFEFSDDTLDPGLSGDSLKTRFVKHDTLGYHTILPYRLSIALEQRSYGFVFREQLSYRGQSFALPAFLVEAGKTWANWQTSILVEAGGHGRFGAGAVVRYSNPSTKFEFRLVHLEGLVIPEVASGVLLDLKLCRWF